MTNENLGTGILILATFAGFMFPQAAKWILLVITLLALWGMYASNRVEELRKELDK